MSKKIINNPQIYKFRNKSFEGYGLNKFRNFLSAPECDCGCGGKGNLILDDVQDLFGFAYNVLADNECGCCAIFAHGMDDKMWAIIKLEDPSENYDYEKKYDPDENPISFLGIDETDYEFFRELDAECNLHCYGLLVQNVNGSWDIVEE